MPTFDSGRATSLGGINIQQRRGSDLDGIRFADNRDAPTSANDLVLYRRSSGLYFWNGSTEYNLLSAAAGSVGDLNAVYENGHLVTIDEGPIVLTDATTAALDLLRLTKSGAGSGDSLELLHTAAATGRAIYIDMNLAIARTGILIDSGGTARTGSDIVFTADSTGTHSCIDINASGAGIVKGFDWVQTHAGSASFAISIAAGNAAGLDDTDILITRGTGIRLNPVLDINDASTGSAAMIDIDLTGAYTGNIIDFATSGIATGNVINMNMDAAVGMTAIHIEGSGDRTEPFFEFTTDSTGTAINLFSYVLNGIHTGNLMFISATAASTGNMISIDMDAAVAARAILLDAGGGARTANLIDVTFDPSGNLDLCEITDTNTGSGHLFDINITSTRSGAVIDIVYSGAATGPALNLDMTTGVAASAFVLTGTGVRTQDIVQIEDSSSGATHIFDINVGSTSSGNVLDITVGAVAFTGDALSIALAATAVASQAIVITSGNMTRTTALIAITDSGTPSGAMFDLNRSAINAGIMFDIDDSVAASTGNIFDYAAAAASTGTIFEINLTNAVAAKLQNFTLAGVRTANATTITHTASGAVDIFQIDDGGTSSGHIFDINCSTASTGNVIDVTASGTKAAGDIIKIVLGTDLAGSAISITGTGLRSVPVINYASDATDAGTDDHIIFITQSGILDSNLIQLTFATAASTGDALSIAMGTNVAGMAMNITSAGTGVATEGSAINIAHTGALVADADVMRIAQATGVLSSTSNVLAVEAAGNSTAGSYAVYINASGTGIEALRVDAGTVLFDETLTVAGLVTVGSIADASDTLTSTMIELNCVADVSARLLVAGSTETAAVTTHDSRIILLDTATGSTLTLPAATGSGAVYKCIVSVLATSNSHVVKVTGDDVMYGMVIISDQDTAGTTTSFVTAADSDTVTLNRTTSGSVTIGEWLEFVDIAADKWAVRGVLTNTGAGATPFSATV